MTLLPLKLGPLEASGYSLLRSGVRWLVADGQHCEAHRPIGYFNVSLEATGKVTSGQPEFADEMELQVAIAPRVSGRLKLSEGLARGGYLSIRTIEEWQAGDAIGQLEVDEPPDDERAGELRPLMLAGRRMTALADVHTGLMPGWHSRTRGWWADGDEKPITLLCQGVCDAVGVVSGAQTAFTEMFEMERQATQMVYVPDHPIAPCAPILLDQISRTPAQFEAILEDAHRYFGGLPNAPTANDWMFLGATLQALGSAPLKDKYSVFTPGGMQHLGPPDAVLMSLAVEPLAILRHRNLGYHMHVMRHHQAAAGPAVKAWLSNEFEVVRRPVDAIGKDYEALVDRLAKTSKTKVIALNRMSTSGHEDISSYMGFDAPLSATLSNVAAKEMNLMLDDIASARGLDIIDIDAIGAELGGAEHLPDGIHQSGTLQTIARQAVLDCLEDVRV